MSQTETWLHDPSSPPPAPSAWDGLLGPSGAGGCFPSAADREAWTRLLARDWPGAHRDATRKRVDACAHQAWPGLPARLLRRFAADGDRQAFQHAYFTRRERVTDLAMLLAMDDDPVRLDDLVDGLWLICEESSWCLPAHWHLAALPRRPVHGLPPEAEQVDLFAAETAALLASVCDLCYDRLHAWDKELLPRIHREIHRRCLAPVLESDAWFWWDGHHNWSPWIVANLLGAGATVLRDRDADIRLTARLAGVLHRYLDGIPDDGYCDEGPSYWNAGTGMTVVALEILRRRTGGAVDGFRLPKLRAMGTYLLSTCLGHGRWVVTADSKPGLQVHPEIPILLGERCRIPDLTRLGREMHCRQGHDPISPLMGGGGLGPRLRRLWWIDPHTTTNAIPVQKTSGASPRDVWFPSGQLAVLREQAEIGCGLCVAVKFGHNHENHNHLDVGQVIVQWDNAPLLIDPGVDTYRRDHFSPRRYSVPWVGAPGHNAPVIHGRAQTPGSGFGHVAPPELAGLPLAARDLQFSPDGTRSEVSADLAPCYPEVSGLRLARRTVILEREATPRVEIRDDIEAEHPVPVILNWLTACEPAEISADGWSWKRGDRTLFAHLEGATEIHCEKIELDDPQLREGWGPQLWRLVATAPASTHTHLRLGISTFGTAS